MKKNYISPATSAIELSEESMLMTSLPMSKDSSDTNNAITNETQWMTNKEKPGAGLWE